MAAPDLTDFFPLITETPDTIVARELQDINAGVDPTSATYADTVPGSIWDDFTRADALEQDRLYDRMATELPAALLPQSATGQWLDLWANVVNLQRKVATIASGIVRFSGEAGTDVIAGVQMSTEAPAPGVEPPTFEVTTSGTIDSSGYYDAPIAALDEGSVGNVPANAITVLNTPVTGPTGVAVAISNPAATSGGFDVESDDDLRVRVMRKFQGINGAGNVDYYENIALNTPGVGYVTVQPNTPVVGHVTITISDMNHQPAPDALVAQLQALLDPEPVGEGYGLAAPGATVIVTTPGVTLATIVSTLELEDGYSLDGAGGTENITPDLTDAVNRYFLSLSTGDDVLYNRVLAAMIDVDGVVNVTELTINGDATDLAVPDENEAELEVPMTLTAA